MIKLKKNTLRKSIDLSQIQSIAKTEGHTIRYTLNEDALWDGIAEYIGEHSCLDELMGDLMDSISEDFLEDGYIIYADFHAEFVRTTVMQFLFSSLIVKDGLSELEDFRVMKAKLNAEGYHANDSRFNDLIAYILGSIALGEVVVENSHSPDWCHV